MKSLKESILSKNAHLDKGPAILLALDKLGLNYWQESGFDLSTEDDRTLVIGVGHATPHMYKFIEMYAEEAELLHKMGIDTIKLKDEVGLSFEDLKPSSPAFTVIGLDDNAVFLCGRMGSRKNPISGWNITAAGVSLRNVGSLAMKNCTFRMAGVDEGELSIEKCFTIPKMEHVEVDGFKEIFLRTTDAVLREYFDLLGFNEPKEGPGPRSFSDSELQGLLGFTWSSELRTINIVGDRVMDIECLRKGRKWEVGTKESK